ncbi:MAG: hypothetical protein ACRDHN_14525 [Thermomicrobiales bacterium]
MVTATQRGRPPDFSSVAMLLGSDRVIRERLIHALESERITAHGLAKLREDYGLTPAETSVFIAYYLDGADLSTEHPSIRRALARDLNLSENTLMHHITSIRRKLGFAARKGSATVLVWCLTSGITDLKTLSAGRTTESDRNWSQALPA